MEKFMELALKAAGKGRGKTSPNPLVGAVIVKDGRVVCVGYHHKYGGKHAEVNAIEKAGGKARGADLYVTLEPCNHYGKQPPCTKAIVEAGIKRVFAAMRDPNRISLSGAEELRKNGVEVSFGMLEGEARKQNEYYITNVCEGRPFITLKSAMTQEGFITYGNGKGKKISGGKADSFVQKLRAEHDAILVGVNTIIKDDPRLSVRQNPRNSPVRVILDSRARTPPNAKILSQNGSTIVFCSSKAPHRRVSKLVGRGAVVIAAREKDGLLDLKEILSKLHSLAIQSVLVEGGKRITTSFLSQKLFDRFFIIVSVRKIQSGMKAFELKRKMQMKITKTKKLGKDVLIVAEKGK